MATAGATHFELHFGSSETYGWRDGDYVRASQDQLNRIQVKSIPSLDQDQSKSSFVKDYNKQ